MWLFYARGVSQILLCMVALSSFAKSLGECPTIHSPPALFSSSVEISSRTLIPFFMPGSVHSGSTSWYDCGRVFPDELRVSSFPDRFPLCLQSGIVSILRFVWVKGVCVFRCNLQPALLTEWPGSFTFRLYSLSRYRKCVNMQSYAKEYLRSCQNPLFPCLGGCLKTHRTQRLHCLLPYSTIQSNATQI